MYKRSSIGVSSSKPLSSKSSGSKDEYGRHQERNNDSLKKSSKPSSSKPSSSKPLSSKPLSSKPSSSKPSASEPSSSREEYGRHRERNNDAVKKSRDKRQKQLERIANEMPRNKLKYVRLLRQTDKLTKLKANLDVKMENANPSRKDIEDLNQLMADIGKNAPTKKSLIRHF